MTTNLKLVIGVGLSAGVTILVDTKIITIARTERVVAMGWLLLFLSFRCVICVMSEHEH